MRSNGSNGNILSTILQNIAYYIHLPKRAAGAGSPCCPFLEECNTKYLTVIAVLRSIFERNVICSNEGRVIATGTLAELLVM